MFPVALVVIHPFVERVIEPVLHRQQSPVPVPPVHVRVLGGPVTAVAGLDVGAAGLGDVPEAAAPRADPLGAGRTIVARSVQVVADRPAVVGVQGQARPVVPVQLRVRPGNVTAGGGAIAGRDLGHQIGPVVPGVAQLHRPHLGDGQDHGGVEPTGQLARGGIRFLVGGKGGGPGQVDQRRATHPGRARAGQRSVHLGPGDREVDGGGEHGQAGNHDGSQGVTSFFRAWCRCREARRRRQRDFSVSGREHFLRYNRGGGRCTGVAGCHAESTVRSRLAPEASRAARYPAAAGDRRTDGRWA